MHFKNNINFLRGLVLNKLFNISTPLNVMFLITNKCNLKCSYCDIPLRNQQELTTDEILKIVDNMASAGTQRLSLLGGEPLLRTDIGEIISRAKKHGMYVNIDSNGLLVKENLDVITKLDLIILSFDGEKKVHDVNRGKGSYEKVVEALEITPGYTKVMSLTLLNKKNIQSVPFILKKARELKFTTLFQVPYHPEGVGSDSLSHLAADQEYREVFRYLLNEKKQGAPIASTTSYLKCLLNWPDYYKSHSTEKTLDCGKCFAGKLFCVMDVNGDLYTCCNYMGSISPPNALELGFEKAFNRLGENLPGCKSCIGGAALESNLVFSPNLKAIWEWHLNTPQVKSN